MSASRPLTPRQIVVLRMRALGLLGSGAVASDPAGVVGHHLAMQAQDFAASRWAVGSRIPGCTEAQVVAAFDRGEIVRSWPMRGTVHVVRAEDLPWMLEHLGPRALSGVRSRWAHLGIDEPFLERTREVATALLGARGRCTRGEFVEALEEAGLPMTGQRAYHVVWYLSQTGTLVQGPVRGRDHELVLLDAWILAPRRLDRDAALAELGVRYLRARGPATVEDLVHWTKLTRTDARRAFEAGGDAIVQRPGPGGPYHLLADQADRLDDEGDTVEDGNALDDSVVALAAFDEHLLGYRMRDAVLDPAHATLVDPGRNGVFRWTVVAGGRVVGTWKRVPLTHHTRVEVTPFARLPPSIRAGADAAFSRWGAFAGTEVVTAWSAPLHS